ncbi:4-nitrophenylphosphatase, putative [Plasmodium knowlesi strain H]|uniref:4-nitrophenylphosphatase, putative n=3 Tax=Plasmodium knowlesi TaxID=5850 RepID=A0A5K1UWI0_PLAKH|nr:4-nitrophenylphosphatase, putative [Plasmodium knowlesi strain H]OTN63663.1 putative 4-nitrophenylphosphatase [Plasmodium knowlesi]CAA9990837.1 4-nitrophenylphosphatase, putative [Plasmodium knowlesi strain H]SBO20969.1 4-nitrophenylphosphatase, putative [Plasmodium knowlesi strain H]SBO21461.1 4-nitrophenylphosphatase, putative [Plasmodium knowlesi strain H]VVS80311.1 4-nitrophenylphosphatase, putative [Plasmodium knowlesi strain H]|eukprot:XP_002262125.1 4-nitrophenylphosphatase, putative [Plasmodium knowlesi strain H]
MSLIRPEKRQSEYESFMKEWQIEKSVDAKEFVDNCQVFFFDCDGVLWRGNEVIQGAVEVINKLIKEKKQIYFITNNSTKSRITLLEKFHKLGFGLIKKENIICTSYAIAKYFMEKEEYTSGKKKIYVIGEKGICEELDCSNLLWLGSYKDNEKKVVIKDDLEITVDKNIGAVVVAIDFNINYYKIQYAHLCINELDAEFIVSNKDATANFTCKQKWAGTGSIVASVEAVSLKKPTVLGKPNLFMIENVLKDLNVDPAKVVMVGDRLDTDISFAKNCNIKSVLVSSGVTDANIYLNHNHSNIVPDFFMKSIAEFL